MADADLNIIVCLDPRECLRKQSHGRNGSDLLQELWEVVDQQGLSDRVQVTPCRCIFGCTYGPRMDVVQRWSGEKVLYGSIEGEATITRRGRVRFSRIPESVSQLVWDNLPPRQERS
jgi:predicted metal-binding protein